MLLRRYEMEVEGVSLSSSCFECYPKYISSVNVTY
jgi:hypothetical protein